MRNASRLRPAALAALCALVSAAARQTTSSTPSGLDSDDARVREAAAEQLVAGALAARHTAIRQAVEAIHADPGMTGNGPGPAKGLALEALGELRAREQLAVLSPEIDYLVLEPVGHCPWSNRPAVRALIRIGLPAVIELLSPAAMERLSAESPSTTQAGAADEASPDVKRFQAEIHLRNVAIVVRYTFPTTETAQAFVKTYDPGYSAAARKHREALLEMMSRLPPLRADPEKDD